MTTMPSRVSGGLFAKLNHIAENALYSIDSGYAPQYDAVRLNAEVHVRVGDDRHEVSSTYYVDAGQCGASEFHCIFRKPRCDVAAVDEAPVLLAAWRALPYRTRVQAIYGALFRLHAEAERLVEDMLRRLPPTFMAMHIRRGDKVYETRAWDRITLQSEDYYAALLAGWDDAVIASDDAPFVQRLQARARSTRVWSVSSYSAPSEHVVKINATHEALYLYALTRALSRGNAFVFSSSSSMAVFALLIGNASAQLVDIEHVVDGESWSRRMFCIVPLGGREGLCEGINIRFVMPVVPTSALVAVALLAACAATAGLARRMPATPSRRLALVVFVAASCGTIILNKMLAQRTRHMLVAVVYQMVFGLIVCAATRVGTALPSRATTLRVLAAVILFPVQLATSMLGLQECSMSTYILVRNFSPIVSATIEQVFGTRSLPSLRMLVSATAMVLGAFVYGIGTLSASFVGLIYLGMNMVTVSMEQCWMKHVLSTRPVDNSWVVLLKNSTFPIVLLLMYARDADVVHSINTFHLRIAANQGVVLLFASCVSGTVLGFAGAALIRMVSASTLLALVSFTKMFVVAWALLWWHEPLSATILIGLVINMLGCVFFTMNNETWHSLLAYARMRPTDAPCDEIAPPESCDAKR